MAMCPTCMEDGFADQTGVRIHHTKVHGERLNEVTKPCSQCMSDITRMESEFGDTQFCDRDCYRDWLSDNRCGQNHPQYDRVMVECPTCESENPIRPNRLDKYQNNFCDRDCYGEWISNNVYGDNHPLWTGGSRMSNALRSLLGSQSWPSISRSVRDRTDDNCAICGDEADSVIDVHHIIPLVGGGTNGKWDLLAVCKTHHRTVESYIKSRIRLPIAEYASQEVL